jgi:hypothetical protein
MTFLRLPREWEREVGVGIVEADGWDIPVGRWPARGWCEVISREEFAARAAVSTVMA